MSTLAFFAVGAIAWLLGVVVTMIVQGRAVARDYVPLPSYEAAKIALHFAEEARDDARRQLDNITAKYHQLRLQGAELAPTAQAAPPPKPIDPLEAAIAEKFGHVPDLYTQAMQQLAKDKADNRSADDIMREILEGVAMDEGSPI